MKFTLEIELGNDAMRTVGDVAKGIQQSFSKLIQEQDMRLYNGVIRDANGNTVGKWEVVTTFISCRATCNRAGEKTVWA